MVRMLSLLMVLVVICLGCDTEENTDPVPAVATYLHIAVGGTSAPAMDGFLLTSSDGITWASPITGTEPILDVACNGTTCVAVGFAGAVYRSTDGETWALIPSAPISTGSLNAVIHDGTHFIATGVIGFDLSVYTSTDGLSWATVTESGGSTSPFDMAHFNSVIVLASLNGPMSSTDSGANFSAMTIGPAPANAVDHNGALFMAALVNQNIYTSTDGTNWTARTDTPTGGLDIEFAGGNWIVVSTGGIIYRSDDDGVTWNTVDTGTGINYRTASGAGDLAIIGGAGGAIVTTTDGANFTQQTSGQTGNVNRIKSFIQ